MTQPPDTSAKPQELFTLDDMGFGWSSNDNRSVTRRGPARPRGFDNADWYKWGGAILSIVRELSTDQVKRPAAAQNHTASVRELLEHLSRVLPADALGKVDSKLWNQVADAVGTSPITSASVSSAVTDAEINQLTFDKLGKWPSFEAQSWACKVVHQALASFPRPAVQEKFPDTGFVLAKETVVSMPDGSNELGYTLIQGVGIFSSAQEVHSAIAELSLPLGWVSMTTGQLLPGWMLPAQPDVLAEDHDSSESAPGHSM